MKRRSAARIKVHPPLPPRRRLAQDAKAAPDNLVRRGPRKGFENFDSIDVKERIQSEGDGLRKLALQASGLDFLPQDDVQHESLGSASFLRHSDRRTFQNGWMLVRDALELERAYLDASEVHGVIGPTLRFVSRRRGGPLDSIPVPSQELPVRALRASVVIDLVMTRVQKLLGHSERRGNEEELSRLSFPDRTAHFVQHHEVDAEGGSGERGRGSRMQNRAGEMAPPISVPPRYSMIGAADRLGS